MIEEYNGHDDIIIGPGLKVGEKFTCDIEWTSDSTVNPSKEFVLGVNKVEWVDSLPKDDNDNPTGELGVLYITNEVEEGGSSVEKHYYMVENGVNDQGTHTFEYVETDDNWDGLVGTEGKFTATFSDLDSDKPKVALSTTGNGLVVYAMSKIPDTRTGVTSVEIDEYKLQVGDVDISYVEVDDISTSEEDGITTTTMSISFVPHVIRTKKRFALSIGHDYID